MYRKEVVDKAGKKESTICVREFIMHCAVKDEIRFCFLSVVPFV